MRTVKEEGKINHSFVCNLPTESYKHIHHHCSQPSPSRDRVRMFRSFVSYLQSARTHTYILFPKPCPMPNNRIVQSAFIHFCIRCSHPRKNPLTLNQARSPTHPLTHSFSCVITTPCHLPSSKHSDPDPQSLPLPHSHSPPQHPKTSGPPPPSLHTLSPAPETQNAHPQPAWP